MGWINTFSYNDNGNVVVYRTNGAVIMTITDINGSKITVINENNPFELMVALIRKDDKIIIQNKELVETIKFLNDIFR